MRNELNRLASKPKGFSVYSPFVQLILLRYIWNQIFYGRLITAFCSIDFQPSIFYGLYSLSAKRIKPEL